MKHILLAALFFSFYSGIFAQYDIKVVNQIACTPVKNQAKTGTCWSFASSSFIESEAIRMGKEEMNLSEMFVVRNIYKDKARNYMLRQGKANFSQGSLAHDLFRVMKSDGIVPDEVYSGLVNGNTSHNHSEMLAGLTGFLDGVRTQKRLSDQWDEAFEGILDTYLGKAPARFTYKGKSYTPNEFADYLGINPEDYAHITSFTHHPFDEEFILEIPDNYSNGSYMNVPLDKMVNIVDNALKKGYTVAWDGDVSEKGFSSKYSLAILPEDESREDLFTEPGKEINVNQENRQENFESYSTTDDHLMHIVGTAKDNKGNQYYIIKNSWGERGPADGFLYMSVPYFKMKTVSITVHKDMVD